MSEVRFKHDGFRVIYEDSSVAIEFGNGVKGATVYVYPKTEGRIAVRKFALRDHLEVPT